MTSRKTNKLPILGILCILYAFTVPAVIVNSGCSTTSEVRSAQTILAVQQTVHNAMVGYRDALQLGKVELTDRIAVRDAYRKFEEVEAAAIAALDFGQSVDDTISPEELSDAAFNLVILIGQIVD